MLGSTTTQMIPITEQDVLTLINDMEELQNYDDTFLYDSEPTGSEIITDCLNDSHYKTLRKMIDFINHKKNNMINKLINKHDIIVKNKDIIINKLKEENNKLKAEAKELNFRYQLTEFMDDTIKYDANNSESLLIYRIYDLYKQWYQANNDGKNILFRRKELKMYLDDRYHDKDCLGYRGLSVLPSAIDFDPNLDSDGN